MIRPTSIVNMMLSTIFLFSLLFGSQGVQRAQAAPPTDLIISEYVEGSSNNKAIELYNGTDRTINLNLDGYHLKTYYNGSISAGTNPVLYGVIEPGEAYVIANSLASPELIALSDITISGSWFNGDDAVELSHGTTVIDVIGRIGSDPGTEWGTALTSTADNTLRRKATVCQGDPVGNDAFDPALEWDGYPIDTFAGLGSHTANCGSTEDTPPSVFSVTPANNASEVAVDANLEIVFTEPVTVPVGGGWFGIACTASGAHTALVSGGPSTFMLNPDSNFSNDEDCTVTILAAQVTDQDAPVEPMEADYGWSFHTALSDACGASYTPIYAIQGSGASTPLFGSTVRLEGVVTADFQGADQLRGFYVQDPVGDGNPATSDGIFVYNDTIDVSAGDRVRVRGTATEYYGQTEISPATLVTICSSGTVGATDVSLPVANIGDWERYEGMKIHFPEELSVTDNYDLLTYGEFSVSSDGRLFQPTNSDPQGSQELNDRRLLLVDDGSTQSYLSEPPYWAEEGDLRLGTTITGLTGVLGYDFGSFRLQPTEPPAFVDENPRVSPPDMGGNLKVAGLNVHNYFNGDGQGGGFPTSRGAETYEAFQLQRAKVITTVLSVDAEIVGLMEIENDGDGPLSAIQDLVDGLNEAVGDDIYAFIPDPSPIGADEIKVALIYKPGRVQPIGAASSDDDPVFSRPPVAQTFEQVETGARLTVIANHFKSKGCGDATGLDLDQGDGQGCYNYRRVQQAEALLAFISGLQTSSGEPDVLVLGDLNAYGTEDPIDALEAGGLVDQIEANIPAAERYSYSYSGQSGYLDHALTTGDLSGQVEDVAIWHSNSDEPAFLDYSTRVHSSPSPSRSSDHDPILISLNLGVRAAFTSNSPILPGQTAVFTNTSITNNLDITFEWDFGDGSPPVSSFAPTHIYETPGAYTVTLTVASEWDASTYTGAFVVAEPLEAGFTSNSPVVLGQAAVLNNTTTGNGLVTYRWDFGDGSLPSSEASPTHTYTSMGAYTITLTATNSLQQDVYSDLFVVGGPLAAGFRSNSPVLPGETAIFINITTGLGPISYAWDFGDGSLPVIDVAPTHVYIAPGEYTVTLTATSALDTSVFAESFIVAEPLEAGFTSSSPVVLGQAAVFTNTTTGFGPVSYLWDFGDGSLPSSEANPTHFYASVGEYTVTLTATNSLQQEVVAGMLAVVEPLAPGFTSNSPVQLGEPVVFTNTTTGFGPINYLWNFGDNSALASDISPQHTYTAPGEYTVILTATNPLESRTFTSTVEVAQIALQFSTEFVEAGEDAGMGALTVTLSSPSPAEVQVSFMISGTAVSGQDYIFDQDDPLVIPAGEMEGRVEVAVLDDLVDEPLETVMLFLANPSGAVLGEPAQAVLRILDDDGPPSVFLNADAVTVSEGDLSVGFVARLDIPTAITVTVSYTTSDGTASAGSDYTESAGVLTFTPGEQEVFGVIPLLQDALDEANETILLALSTPTNASLGEPAEAVITLTDDDPTPALSFAPVDYSAGEDAGTVTLTVTLSASSALTVTAGYRVSGGTADVVSDFTGGTGLLIFEPGETSKTFTLGLLDDEDDEEEETVEIELSAHANAGLGDQIHAVLTIQDNDEALPPQVNLFLPLMLMPTSAE